MSLNILLSHSRSLKFIRNDTVEWGVCKSVLILNYARISYSFWNIQRQRMAWPWNRGRVRSRALKMAQFDRSFIYDFLVVGHSKYSSILYHFRVIWRSNLGYSSLKVIQAGTIRKLACSFLFAFHSNCGTILHHFRDEARYRSKIVIFSYSLAFDAHVSVVPVGILPSRLVWKNLSGGLPDSEKLRCQMAPQTDRHKKSNKGTCSYLVAYWLAYYFILLYLFYFIIYFN